MEYRIYPPIGFSRLGNSDSEYYFSPESSGSIGTELDQEGREIAVSSFKDAHGKVKRMAARYSLLEFSDEHPNGRTAQLPEGAVVRWSLDVANLKDAVVRSNTPQRQVPNVVPEHPIVEDARLNRIISASINVSDNNPVPMLGSYLQGTAKETEVFLGEAFTDSEGRLVVLGGRGITDSPEGEPIGDDEGSGNYFKNPGWYDDVADGSVKAEIVFATGEVKQAKPGWLVVGPPDFAPGVTATVTLYDVIQEVAISNGWMTPKQKPNFVQDIKPIIERTRSLKWVNQLDNWGDISNDWARLSDASDSQNEFRKKARDAVINVASRLRNYNYTKWQSEYLDKWVDGNFENIDPEAPNLSEALTRSALDGTVGQGFLPGIEAGILLLDSSLYDQPFDFRLSDSVKPGWVTALMAQPWQADFLKCANRWWPSQRPDTVMQADGGTESWVGNLDEWYDHRIIAEDQYVMGMGVVTPSPTADDPERQIEEGRTNI